MSLQRVTHEEYLLIREAAANPLHHLYIEMLWASGGRSTEVAELKPENVSQLLDHYLIMHNKKQHTVYFDQTTNTMKPIKHPRSDKKQVFIGMEEIEHLLEYIDEHKIGQNRYIFSNGDRSSPWTHTNCWYVVTGAAKKAGVRKVNKDGKIMPAWPHTFRHGQAIFLMKATHDIILVRDQLGHSSVATTEIYLGLTAEEKSDLILQVERETREAAQTA